MALLYWAATPLLQAQGPGDGMPQGQQGLHGPVNPQPKKAYNIDARY